LDKAKTANGVVSGDSATQRLLGSTWHLAVRGRRRNERQKSSPIVRGCRQIWRFGVATPATLLSYLVGSISTGGAVVAGPMIFAQLRQKGTLAQGNGASGQWTARTISAIEISQEGSKAGRNSYLCFWEIRSYDLRRPAGPSKSALRLVSQPIPLDPGATKSANRR